MIFCGVDGGGTKTKIVLANDDEVIEVLDCGPSSIDTVSVEEMGRVISEAIEEFYLKNNLEKIDSIYLGLGGIATEEDIKNVNSKIREISHIKQDAIVNSGNDITNAYYSACSGRNNITLIIGTGSVAYGIDENGNSHRTSGIHFKEGDFGSGYDVGVRALKYMGYAFDKRISTSPLIDFLFEKFNITDMGSLISFYDNYKTSRTYIASLARDVVEFAQKEDEYALRIIDEATDEIMLMIKAVDKQINLSNREIGIIGGLGNSEIYFKTLKEKVLDYDTNFKIHKTEQDAEYGSLMIARNQIKKD